MAEPNKINIDITSTANTAGVERAEVAVRGLTAEEERLNAVKARFLTAAEAEVAEVNRLVAAADRRKASIFGVTSAMEEEARAQDVLEAKRRVAERTLNASANQVKGFGNFVNQAGFQVTDFAVQVQGGTSAITAFSQQFPQLIGSINQSGISLGNIKGGLLSLPIDIGTALSIGATAIAIAAKLGVDAYGDMREAQDDLTAAQKRGSDQLLFQQQQQKLLNDQAREEFILDFYKRQTDELEKQVSALQRINALRAAQSSTAEAQAAAGVAVAQNTGGNVGAAQANALAVGTQNRLDAIAGELATAEAVAAEAALKLAAANTLLAEFTDRGDRYTDAFKEADAAFEQARSNAEEAQLDLENQRAIAAEKIAQIQANNTAALSELAKGANDSLKQSATDTLAAIQQQAAETGGELSSNARQAVADLQKALADGIIKPDEMALIIDALNQLRASREGTDREIIDGMQALRMSVANTQQLVSLVAELRGMVELQRQQIQGLSNN